MQHNITKTQIPYKEKMKAQDEKEKRQDEKERRDIRKFKEKNTL